MTRFGKLAILLFAALANADAFAATATGTLTVEAGVGTACSVGNTTMNFGGAIPSNNPALNITGSVNINCTTGAPFTVDLDGGSALQGTLRGMKNGTNRIQYQLYLDVGHTSVWGLACCGGGSVAGVGIGAPETLVVYGGIGAGAIGSAPAGEYSDTVNITLTF
jgi:spore coat protein U-like protein